ncbi:MAG: SAM-dependent chlorinase/fluorinase [Planctomycetales bacterium]|nr:SAM-dependent chlorinase/fluorinase [Planctomycetales bacterium]
MPLVTLTTDFGISSPYVAQMKGVLLSFCPEIHLLDITHGIHPQNVAEGAIVLADVTPFFPADTLHIAVVDPGVGTARRLLYVEAGEQKYLLPDNGLLTLVAGRSPPSLIISLENRNYWRNSVSSTFHGRDILAPVAAQLCRGVSPRALGPQVADFIHLPLPEAAVGPGRIAGHITYIDSLGNLITNITQEQLAQIGLLAESEVSLLGKTIVGIGNAYADAPPGSLTALCDSQGRLEIAMVNGSAAREMTALAGTAVEVTGRGA